VSAYIVAQISIHDRPRYERYVAGFMPTLPPFGGRLLAADEAPQVLEGAWERDKLILIGFPDAAAARAWAASPAYAAIAGDRLAATDGVVILAAGLAASTSVI
jgi:uncharacterized protein (DUF1330 family)